MSSDNINTEDLLKYASLQMASEAVYGFIPSEAAPADPLAGSSLNNMDVTNLVKGNLRNSLFTSTAAADLIASGWQIKEHLANTATGFSGTLFENSLTHELVLSFRSTEFLDDAVRDNTATNTLEFDGTGFAWGQIDDLQKWFTHLQDSGLINVPLIGTGLSRCTHASGLAFSKP